MREKQLVSIKGHEERRSRPEGPTVSTGPKGANYPDKPTNRGKATQMNRENMSGPTGPGPPGRQRNAENTNPMACQDCRDLETSTSRTTNKTTRPGQTRKGADGPARISGPQRSTKVT